MTTRRNKPVFLTENGLTPAQERAILKASKEAKMGINMTEPMEIEDALLYLKKRRLKSVAKKAKIKAMKNYQFSIVVTQDDEGVYIGYVPNLPGCHTQAKRLTTLYKRLEEAIELYLEVQKERSEIIPRQRFIEVKQMM